MILTMPRLRPLFHAEEMPFIFDATRAFATGYSLVCYDVGFRHAHNGLPTSMVPLRLLRRRNANSSDGTKADYQHAWSRDLSTRFEIKLACWLQRIRQKKFYDATQPTRYGACHANDVDIKHAFTAICSGASTTLSTHQPPVFTGTGQAMLVPWKLAARSDFSRYRTPPVSASHFNYRCMIH
jgi:hypothetical protein